MYDIYYDDGRRGDFDLHEFFSGSWMELQERISDLRIFGCTNIEFYEVR